MNNIIKFPIKTIDYVNDNPRPIFKWWIYAMLASMCMWGFMIYGFYVVAHAIGVSL